jgi:hypothetical protein
LLMLAYGQTSRLQVVHGPLCGMGPSTATPWLHVLLPVLRAALRPLGDAPARSLRALAQRLGVAEADAATVVAPLEEAAAPEGVAPVAASESPLGPRTGPSGGSSAPTTLVHSKRVRAGRNKTTLSNMSCSCMPSSRSSCSVTPTVAVCLLGAWRRPPPTRSRPGGGGGRRSAAWR